MVKISDRFIKYSYYLILIGTIFALKHLLLGCKKVVWQFELGKRQPMKNICVYLSLFW